MLNDPFILRQSEHFGRRLDGLAADADGRVRAGFALALGRPPSAEELREWADHAARFGTASFCRMLLNSSEFLFVN